MAGFSVHISFEGLGLAEDVLRGIRERSEDLSVPLSAGGELMMGSIRRNFKVGGRPAKWKPWAPSTAKKYEKEGRRSRHLLMDRGQRGGLMGSVDYRARRDELLIGSNLIHARIHQFGGRAGRGRAVTIPARPYMLFQKSNVRHIARAIGDYLAGGR